MKRSIICAILFVLAGIFYLASAIKGNIPIYYIFGVLLLILGLLYIKRACIEKDKEDAIKSSNEKTKVKKGKTKTKKETKEKKVK